MKGQTWERILFVLVGLISLLVLVSVGNRLFSHYYPKEKRISGSKGFVVDSILNYVYDCYTQNNGKRGSVVCFELSFSSNEEIVPDDFLARLDTSKVPSSQVVVDNLGSSGEIIIRYENEKIYVEKVESERISS